MNNETRATVSTKADKTAAPVKTALILNWEGMTPDDIRALAQQALIVKLQGNWRRNTIPTEETVNVADHKVGTRAPKSAPNILDMINKMSPEQRAAAVAALTAAA